MGWPQRSLRAVYRAARPIAQPVADRVFQHLAQRLPDDPGPIRYSEAVFQHDAADEEYAAYGATRVVWGQDLRPFAVWKHKRAGIGYAASVQCLSAGSQRLHEDERLRDAVVKDIAGDPVEVMWLWDLTHRGTRTLHGCTNNPTFREYVQSQVRTAMAAGATGLHIDDHLGTASTLGLGGGFCDACMAGFRTYLAAHAAPADLEAAGVHDLEGFDYRSVVRRYAPTRRQYRAAQADIPLMSLFRLYHLDAAAQLVAELKDLAAQEAGRPVPVTANAVLPDMKHVRVLPHLDGLVSELVHMNPDGTLNVDAVTVGQDVARRFRKPFFYTAFGPEWADVKTNGRVQLVNLWVALAYSAGCWFLVPHPRRQWAYTPAGGHDVFSAAPAAYAPIYRFIQDNRRWFDGFEHSDEKVAAPLGLATRLRRRGSRTVLHLVNAAYDAAADTTIPMHDIEVEIPAAAVPAGCSQALVMAWPGDRSVLPLTRRQETVAITLPQVGLWTLVTLAADGELNDHPERLRYHESGRFPGES